MAVDHHNRSRWARAFDVAAWLMTVLLAVMFIWSLGAQQHRMMVYFGLFALATFGVNLRWRVVESLPGPPRALLVFGLAVNAFGWALRWLDNVPFYDEAAHGLTTAGLVAVLPALMPHARAALRRNPGIEWIFLVGLGATTGILWEVYEWTADHFVVPPGTMSIDDTITDLIADFVGAMLGALVGLWTSRAKPER